MNNNKDTKPPMNPETVMNKDEIKKLWQAWESPIEKPQERIEFSYKYRVSPKDWNSTFIPPA